MIRHVVMMKFKDETTVEARTEFLKMLGKLVEDVEVVRALEVGQNFTQSPRACDLVLMVDVEDEAALKAYAEHPNHQPVIQRVGEVCSATYVVDYEIVLG